MPVATRPGRWWHDRRAVVMVLLGVVSGVIGKFTIAFEWFGGQASIGIVFGVLIAAYLVRIGLATVVRAFGFVLCSVASWMVAYQTAREIFGALPETFADDWKFLIAGIVAGLLGAGLLAAAIAVLFPYFRRWRPVLRTALVGGAFGALLWPAMVWDYALLLFPPWQAAFALCFALGFPAVAGEPASDGE